MAATLLECSYDDLKQRHKERKIRRIMTAAVTTSAIFLFFGSVSTILALRIQSQSVLIKNQSKQIEKQYREVMVRQSKSLADTSLRLLQEGDRLTSILIAKEALPNKREKTDVQYTEQAQYALTEALHTYENGTKIMPAHLLKHDTETAFFKVSPSGKRILSVDIMGKVYVWEAESGRLLYTVRPKGSKERPEEEQYGFLSDTQLFLPVKGCLTLYDMQKEKELYRLEGSEDYSFVADEKKKFIAVRSGEELGIAEASSGSIIYKYKLNSVWTRVEAGTFHSKRDLFGCAVAEENEKATLLILDLKNKKVYKKIPAETTDVSQLLFTDKDELLAAMNENFLRDKNMGGKNKVGEEDGSIGLFHIKSGKCKWLYKSKGKSIERLKFIGKKLLYETYNSIGTLNLENGTGNGEAVFDSQIVGCCPPDEEGNFIGMQKNGTVFHFSGTTLESNIYSESFKVNSSNVSYFSEGSNFYAALAYNSNAITIYKRAEGSGIQEFAEFENSIDSVKFNKKGTECLITLYENGAYEQLIIFDRGTGRKIKTLKIEGGIKSAFYVGDNEEKIAAVTEDAVFIYDRQGNLLERRAFENSINRIVSVTPDGATLIVADYNAVTCYSLNPLKKLEELPLKDADGLCYVGAKMKCYAAVSRDEDTLTTYDFNSAQKKKSIPVNSSFVSALFMDESEKRLFVTYMDKTTEVYDATSLKRIQTYTDFDIPVTGCMTLDEKGDYLLYGIDKAYLCKKDSHEVIGKRQSFQDAIPKTGEFVLS